MASARALCAAVLAAVGLLCLPALASAAYEQMPEHFGESGEAGQLGGGLGAAVNESGAGGVEAGSLYVVGGNHRVVRYAPGEEGEEPSFEEAWGWGVGSEEEGAPASGYQRCGPALATEPAERTYHRCGPVNPNAPFGGEEVGHFEALGGVAVDQATGYVYVRNNSVAGTKRKHHMIEVFTATGSPLGEGFGDVGSEGPPAESIEEGPEKLHFMVGTATKEAIAVDDAGTVYLTDRDYISLGVGQARVMSFRPETPGDYEHYVYTGQQNDIVTGSTMLSRIALIGADRLAVSVNDEAIREYEIGGAGVPLCARAVSGQLFGMTTNRATGEIFYSTFSDRSIHRLAPCDTETGEFEELQKIKPAPLAKEMRALAVNATRAWSSDRPTGILYAVDAENGIGDVFAPAKVFPPDILSESVANTGVESTTLQAQIDPRGFEASYHFEYLTQAAYLANGESFEGPNVPVWAPAKDGVIAPGKAASVAANVSGLTPDTAYRFRAVAASECDQEHPEEPCEAAGEAASFATYPTAPVGLPDGRAYELVSPAQKHGGEVFPADPRLSSCGLVGPGSPSECKPPGTSNNTIFPMQSTPGGNSVTYMGYAFSPTEGAAVFNSYVSRRSTAGWQTQAMSPALLNTKGGQHLAYDSELNADTIFQPSPPLAPGAPAGYSNIYLQSAADPSALTPLLTSPPPNRGPGGLALTYAGATPDFSCQFFAANDGLTPATPYAPAPPDPGASGRDLYEWCDGELALVNVLPGNSAVASSASFASASPEANGVSDDGRRVFFKAEDKLYVREDGKVTREVTKPGTFLTASPDGLRALLSSGCLYSIATEACADLTQGQGGFQGIAGSSEDLSRIYFIDTAALTGSGQNERGEEAEAGKFNLYLYDEGDATFIATLLDGDGDGGVEGLGFSDWASAPGQRTAEASPSGRFLAFGSKAQLTGYDNVGPCGEKFDPELGENVVTQIPCTEVFLYDSAGGELTCASCNPSGEAPRGHSFLRRIAAAKEWLPQPRYLTDQGRLYFDSRDRLSIRDANGKVEDVYQAEPQGAGSCTRPQGCVRLISPGSGSVDSNFLVADEDGSDVFFTSRERLVNTDTDELIDLYDARVGGGFASETETRRPECQGEACQPSPSPPAGVTPASAAFSGAGNVNEAKAKKHKKKAHKKHKRRHRRANADRRAQR